jgi:hypothetical protein
LTQIFILRLFADLNFGFLAAKSWNIKEFLGFNVLFIVWVLNFLYFTFGLYP